LHPPAGAGILSAHSHPASRLPAMRGRPWTPADDRLVLTLPPADAARRLHRTLAAVYTRRATLRPGHVRRPWTPAEDRLVMRMPPPVASRYIGRSEWAIRQRRRKLGLPKDPAPVLR
jgi:hypothetical protein